jgi:methionyl-tRNA formyltransferase
MRVVYIGTGAIGVPTLQLLLASEHEIVGIVTQPDRPAGRRQKIQSSPVKQLIGRYETERLIPVLQPQRIKDPTAVDQIGHLQPDIIVVVAYGQILPRAVLQLPKLACLNVHASLLPRWRGAAPIQAAIAAGDAETGITIMYMDEGLDTGDILLQRPAGITSTDTGASLHDRLANLAPEALFESLRLFEAGAAPRLPQDPSAATYAPKLTRQDGLIDWSLPAEVIVRKIRAYQPWPGAFTTLQGRTLKVFAAKAVELRGEPGQVLSADNDIAIAAGRGAVSLTEVQPEGKRRMSVAQYLHGYPVAK